jgi:hypothetical protein
VSILFCQTSMLTSAAMRKVDWLQGGLCWDRYRVSEEHGTARGTLIKASTDNA